MPLSKTHLTVSIVKIHDSYSLNLELSDPCNPHNNVAEPIGAMKTSKCFTSYAEARDFANRLFFPALVVSTNVQDSLGGFPDSEQKYQAMLERDRLRRLQDQQRQL